MAIFRNLLNSERRETKASPMPATFDGRFLVECAVAGGTHSVVWRARDLATSRPVALKFFAPALVRDPTELARVRQVVAGLRAWSHPGFLAAQEVVVSGKYAAVVTPWIDGPTLRQMLGAQSGQRFEVEDLRRWLRGVVDILEDMHAHGIVHGALTPDVLVQQAGEIYVVGAGVNAWLRNVVSGPGRDPTPENIRAYLSPAQQRAEPPQTSDDLYALGAIAYELLAGTPPEGGWWQRLPRSIARQRRKNGGRGEPIPSLWEKVIRRCLEPRERDRVGSMRELRVRLELGGPVPRSPGVAPAVVPHTAAVETMGAAASTASSAPPASSPDPRAAPAVAVAAAPPPPATSPTAAAQPRPPAPPLHSPSPLPPRPPLRGSRAAVSDPVAESAPPSVSIPAAEPAAVAAVTDSPLRTGTGALLLRSVFALLTLVTMLVGGRLAWHVYERHEQTREFARAAPESPPAEIESEPSIARESPSAGAASAPPMPAAVTEPEPEIVPPAPAEPIPAEPAPESEPAPVAEGPVDATEYSQDGDEDLDRVVPPVVPPVPTPEVATGALQVRSDPAGTAFVVRHLDHGTAVFEGEAPAELHLPAGRYVVEFRQADTSRSAVVDVDPARPAVAQMSFPVTDETTDPAPIIAASSPSPPVAVPEFDAVEPILGDEATSIESVAEAAAPPPPASVPSADDSGRESAGAWRAPPRDEGVVPVNAHAEPIVLAAEGPPLDAGIFELGDVDVAPRLIERVDPLVSRRLFRSSGPARVELVLVIDRMGRVASATLHKTTDDSLVEPSLRAVRLWRFRPATKRGQAVPVRVAVPLAFQST